MLFVRKIIKIGLLAIPGFILSFQSGTFKSSQLQNNRVKSAYTQHWQDLQMLLGHKKIDKTGFSLYLRVFKEEGILEAWGKNKSEKRYIHLRSFDICAKSGTIGPKRRQGDGQVPEGFYEIATFQPQSSYHLALKVSYPNKSDRLKATSKDPGGDIMIHGNCVTIGCIPIEDLPIEQLYVLCVEAKNNGSVIYTDIYPFKFDAKNTVRVEMVSNTELKRFWTGLKQAADHFDATSIRAAVRINAEGNYIIQTN